MIILWCWGRFKYLFAILFIKFIYFKSWKLLFCQHFFQFESETINWNGWKALINLNVEFFSWTVIWKILLTLNYIYVYLTSWGLGAFTLLIFQQFLTCIGIPSFGALKWHSFLDIFNCVLGRKISMYNLSSIFFKTWLILCWISY